ncbi:cytosine-specific methyltransferase [Bacteroidia bacterium]|nr:cytosine-specific methyltransferase [Bacteroidia bacterium]
MDFYIGQHIRDLRIKKGLSLSQLAILLEIDVANLSKIETGRRDFDEKRLQHVCEIFRLDYDHMRQEYVSEKIAKQIYDNNFDSSVLKLAEQKVEYLTKIKLNSQTIPVKEDDWRLLDFCNPNAEIRLGTLFSGIGAIEHAFRRLGLKHEIVFAGDIDPHVKESYQANYKINPQDWHNDVTKFSAKKYEDKIDILVGGSPCQAFSIVGKRKGLEDIRGTLFYDFARVVNETKPKVFIFENVKGLVNHDNGKTWQIVTDVFNDLGYKIKYQVLNSRDYAIPQNRERIFVVGFQDHSIKFEFPNKIQLEYTMQDFLEDFTESNYYLKEKGIKFVTSSKNKNKCYTQINGNIALCQKANQQYNWHGDFVFEEVNDYNFDEFIFDVNTVEEKYYLSDKVRDYVLAEGTKNFKTSTKTDLEIARPILQTIHKMHRAGIDNYVTHKGRIRKLTPKECLRLMGFRDDFKQVVSDTQMYRQAGNSIVVDILIAILKQMDITKFGK